MPRDAPVTSTTLSCNFTRSLLSNHDLVAVRNSDRDPLWSGGAFGMAERKLVGPKPRRETITIAAQLHPVDADRVAAVLDQCAARVVRVVDVPLNEERKTLREGGVERNEMPRELDTIGTGAAHRQRPETGSFGGGLYVVGAQAQRRGSLADLDKSLFQPRPEGTGRSLVPVDDSHQLDVIVTEWNDAIAGAVARMTPAFDRCESVLFAEPQSRGIEFVNRDDHVVDSQHALTLGE